jgi:hypothetical protein
VQSVENMSSFRRNMTPRSTKRRFAFSDLHGVISQKTEVIISTAVRSSNPTLCMTFFLLCFHTAILNPFFHISGACNVSRLFVLQTRISCRTSCGETARFRGQEVGKRITLSLTDGKINYVCFFFFGNIFTVDYISQH